MAIFLNEFTIWEQFLKGIPYKMLLALIIDGGLIPEVNIVEEFVTEARAYKSSVKIVAQYLGHNCNCASHSGPSDPQTS